MEPVEDQMIVDYRERKDARAALLTTDKNMNMTTLQQNAAAVNKSNERDLFTLYRMCVDLGDMNKTMSEKIMEIMETNAKLEGELAKVKLELAKALHDKEKERAPPEVNIFGKYDKVTDTKVAPPAGSTDDVKRDRNMYLAGVAKEDLIHVDNNFPAIKLSMEGDKLIKLVIRSFVWMRTHRDSDGIERAPADMLLAFSPDALEVLRRIATIDDEGKTIIKPHEYLNTALDYLNNHGLTLDEGLDRMSINDKDNFRLLQPGDEWIQVKLQNGIVKDKLFRLGATTTGKSKTDAGAVSNTVHALIRLYPTDVATLLRAKLRPSTEADKLGAMTPDAFCTVLFDAVQEIFNKHQHLFYATVNTKANAEKPDGNWRVAERAGSRGRGRGRGGDNDTNNEDKTPRATEATSDTTRGRTRTRFEEAAGGGSAETRPRSRSRSAERTCNKCFQQGHDAKDCVFCQKCFKTFSGDAFKDRLTKLAAHKDICPNKNKDHGDIPCGSIATKRPCWFQSQNKCRYKH